MIAHPELNPLIQENPNEMYEQVKNGALVQIATGSILGKNGGKAKKIADQLLEANLVHFMASVVHREKKGKFCLKEAYKQVEKNHGRNMRDFLQENMQLLVDGEAITGLEPQRVKTKKLLGFL